MSHPGGQGVRADWASDTDGLGAELLAGGEEVDDVRRRGSRGSGGKLVAGLLVLLALVLVATYGVGVVVAGDRVPRGTTVAGVDIGGLTPAAATDKLRTGLAPLLRRPIQVTYDGSVRSVVPAQAGLGFDYHGTVVAAGGRSAASPQRLWDYYTGGASVAPVVVVDDPMMQEALVKLSAGIGLPVKEGSVRFRDGKVVPVFSRAGLGLDRAKAEALLMTAVGEKSLGDPLALPVSTARPYIDAAAVRDAVRRFGRPAMSAPVILQIGTHQVVATPKRFSAALSMIPSGRTLVPVVNGALLLQSLKPVMKQFGVKPRNATVRLVHGRPRLVPAKIGLTVDVGFLEQHFAAYAARGPGARVMQVHAVLMNPQVGNAAVRRLGVRHEIASFTLHGGRGQAATLARAAGRLDGTLVRPGGTFSLLDTLGAMGARSQRGVQAGLDTVATGVFNAAYLAGFTDVAHHAAHVHVAGRPVAREISLPAGSDVAFTDPTRWGALLGVEAHGDALTVRLWSTHVWDVRTSVGPRTGRVAPPVLVSTSRGCRPRTGQPGFTVSVVRVATRPGDVQRTRYTATYRPTPTVACAGPVRRPRHHHG